MAVATNEIQPGPYSKFRTISLVATAQTVKANPGRIYEFFATNSNAARRFIKLYDKATAPTVGTDTPVMTLPIDPGPNGQISIVSDMGWDFQNGIYIAATTAVADSDTGAPSANDVVVNIQYK